MALLDWIRPATATAVRVGDVDPTPTGRADCSGVHVASGPTRVVAVWASLVSSHA